MDDEARKAMFRHLTKRWPDRSPANNVHGRQDATAGTNTGRRKPPRTPKGRQVDPAALAEVQALLTDRPRRRDLLIEHLHLIQDRYGYLLRRAISPRWRSR